MLVLNLRDVRTFVRTLVRTFVHVIQSPPVDPLLGGPLLGGVIGALVYQALWTV